MGEIADDIAALAAFCGETEVVDKATFAEVVVALAALCGVIEDRMGRDCPACGAILESGTYGDPEESDAQHTPDCALKIAWQLLDRIDKEAEDG